MALIFQLRVVRNWGGISPPLFRIALSHRTLRIVADIALPLNQFPQILGKRENFSLPYQGEER